MDKIDNIKFLYSKIEGKTKFIKDLSEILTRSPNTIRNHWFSEHGFWAIPKALQDKIIEIMQNKISNQNK